MQFFNGIAFQIHHNYCFLRGVRILISRFIFDNMFFFCEIPKHTWVLIAANNNSISIYWSN